MKTFTEEISQGLSTGASMAQLLGIIQAHKARGLTQAGAYDALETLWHEFSGHELSESREVDILGGLMDRVWGFCSSKDAIWDTSLSRAETVESMPIDKGGRG